PPSKTTRPPSAPTSPTSSPTSSPPPPSSSVDGGSPSDSEMASGGLPIGGFDPPPKRVARKPVAGDSSCALGHPSPSTRGMPLAGALPALAVLARRRRSR